jgi:hypothetical protein
MPTIPERACAKAARLISARQDRALVFAEQLSLRFHLAICEGCTNYARQVRFLRQAVGRWGSYSGEDGKP